MNLANISKAFEDSMKPPADDILILRDGTTNVFTMTDFNAMRIQVDRFGFNDNGGFQAANTFFVDATNDHIGTTAPIAQLEPTAVARIADEYNNYIIGNIRERLGFLGFPEGQQ